MALARPPLELVPVESNPVPVPPADLGAGARLGKYEILKRLATGGMAEIFLARVSGLLGFQKVVVIKRILPQLANQADFIGMFLDEARIAATLQHPNVVQVYDVGVADKNYFIAMEYLHGEDLRSIQKAAFQRGARVPFEHALNILMGVCSGLHYAHEKCDFDGNPLNIVHRDVTPQNIVITYEGGIRLLDFGIAKASNSFGETRFGTLKGKIPYMSPEQCRGEPLDRRSDIFSLGIMLYELTLGKRLYKGASDFEILKKIVEGRVAPPHLIDPGYPPRLEAIVMRALAKERSARYSTARELQADLETLAHEERMHISPLSLQSFMAELFGHKIEAWREAKASGKSLDQHVQATVKSDEFSILDDETDAVDAVLLDQLGSEAQESSLPQPPNRRLDPLPLNEPRRSRRGRAAFAGLALLLAGGGGYLALRPPAQPRAVSAAPPSPSLSPPVSEAPAQNAPRAIEAARSPSVAATPPQVGILEIRTSPSRAALYLDGKRLEKTSPVTLDRVPAGPAHVLLAQLAGYKDVQEHFAVKPSEVVRLDLHLHHAASWAGHPARATSKRPTLSVAVEAKPEPVARVEAPPAAKLEGEGTLVLASSPWCNVRIDGVDKGPTPLNVKLPAGSHAVVLTNAEFKISRSLPVLVLPNQTLRKKLDFGSP